MPWWSSDGSGLLTGAMATLLAGVAMVTACVSSTTRYYLPNASQDRLNVEELRDRADALVRVECPRLLNGRPSASGVARIVVEVAPNGEVARARIDRSSGDERMDAIFGALAAQLKVDAPTGARAAPPVGRGLAGDAGPAGGSDETGTHRLEDGRLSIGYSCAPGRGAVTVELNR